MSTKRLDGKVALVTGSGRAIGRAEALEFARQGAAVVVSDMGVDENGRSTAEIVTGEIEGSGGRAIAVTHDLSVPDGAQRTVNAAVDAFGRLDILVNNAGLRAANPIDKLTEEQWDTVLDSHLKTTFLTMKFAVPVFRRQGGGVIVNTSSEAGLGMIFNSAYAAAKEGIVGLTRSAAREQGRFGIRCNLIRPRVTVDSGGGKWEREVFSRWKPMIDALGPNAVGSRGGSKLGDVSRAEQVATFVVWLCTDRASDANGLSFYVSGEDIGLWSEPELIRSIVREGSWDMDSLDKYGSDELLRGMKNEFYIDNPLTIED